MVSLGDRLRQIISIVVSRRVGFDGGGLSRPPAPPTGRVPPRVPQCHQGTKPATGMDALKQAVPPARRGAPGRFPDSLPGLQAFQEYQLLAPRSVAAHGKSFGAAGIGKDVTKRASRIVRTPNKQGEPCRQETSSSFGRSIAVSSSA